MRKVSIFAMVAVLAALVFSKHLFDADAAERAGLAFVVFCALASAVYLVNDLFDLERDRLHPVKRALDVLIYLGGILRRMPQVVRGLVELLALFQRLLCFHDPAQPTRGTPSRRARRFRSRRTPCRGCYCFWGEDGCALLAIAGRARLLGPCSKIAPSGNSVRMVSPANALQIGKQSDQLTMGCCWVARNPRPASETTPG